MDAKFQSIINRLRQRMAENQPGAVSRIDSNSSTVVYATDVIEILNILDQRLSAIEQKLSSPKD